MKKIGIIGGIGPESTQVYYHHLNHKFKALSPTGQHPEFMLYSINMWAMGPLIMDQKWDELVDFLVEKIAVLEKTGVDYVALAANTPHVIQDKLIPRLKTPFISIIKETAKAVENSGQKRVALFGTKVTLDSGVYSREAEKLGIDLVLPSEKDQLYIHEKYFEELMVGDIRQGTKDSLLGIAHQLKEGERIEGLILGGTELSLILNQKDFTGLQVFDSTEIHADSMIEKMMED